MQTVFEVDFAETFESEGSASTDRNEEDACARILTLYVFTSTDYLELVYVKCRFSEVAQA